MKMKKIIAAALVIATMTTEAAFAMPHSHNRHERFQHERWEQPRHQRHIDRHNDFKQHEMHRRQEVRKSHMEHRGFNEYRNMRRHGW